MNSLIEKYKTLHKLSNKDVKSFQSTDDIILHDGSLFSDFDEFCKNLDMIKSSHCRLVIHPDYDVDGIMGGRIAKTGLDILKISDNIELYYPKSKDGYGLTIVAIDKIIEKWPDTKYILTVDNGINTKEAVDYAYEKDIRVIVTDHHNAKLELFPDKSLVAINPKRVDKIDTYPFKEISGSCVIWKLLLAYANKYHMKKEYELIYDLMPFVGISIISDVMPAINENRRILKESIERLNDHYQISLNLLKENVPISYLESFNGLRLMIEFLKNNKMSDNEISDTTIGFMIAPILNSPRRMHDDSTLAFELFNLTDDKVIERLNALNEQRKEEVAIASSKFMSQYPDYEISDLYGIVAQSDDIRHGIVGLIAGNVTEKFHIPSIILSKDYGGSARAPYAYNLETILKNIEKSNPDYFVKWGGHEQAAGVMIHEEYYHEFQKDFNTQCKEFIKTVKLDDRVIKEKAIELDVLNLPTIKEVEDAVKLFNSLRPFSREVPEPKFKITFDYLSADESYMTNGKHVKFTISDKLNNKMNIIVWGQGLQAKEINPYKKSRITVSGLLDVNVWKSYTNKIYKTVQLTSTLMSVEYMED